jgi:hypothetical protein
MVTSPELLYSRYLTVDMRGKPSCPEIDYHASLQPILKQLQPYGLIVVDDASYTIMFFPIGCDLS